MANAPPLSSTVSVIFDKFFAKLESEQTLGQDALEALKQSFQNQKFDHENLRKALFASSGAAK